MEQDTQGELKSVIILTLIVFEEFWELIESAWAMLVGVNMWGTNTSIRLITEQTILRHIVDVHITWVRLIDQLRLRPRLLFVVGLVAFL